ncbi:hypothetical protein PCE1_003756 [Barthelona sp. PCE]
MHTLIIVFSLLLMTAYANNANEEVVDILLSTPPETFHTLAPFNFVPLGFSDNTSIVYSRDGLARFAREFRLDLPQQIKFPTWAQHKHFHNRLEHRVKLNKPKYNDNQLTNMLSKIVNQIKRPISKTRVAGVECAFAVDYRVVEAFLKDFLKLIEKGEDVTFFVFSPNMTILDLKQPSINKECDYFYVNGLLAEEFKRAEHPHNLSTLEYLMNDPTDFDSIDSLLQEWEVRLEVFDAVKGIVVDYNKLAKVSSRAFDRLLNKSLNPVLTDVFISNSFVFHDIQAGDVQFADTQRGSHSQEYQGYESLISPKMHTYVRALKMHMVKYGADDLNKFELTVLQKFCRVTCPEISAQLKRVNGSLTGSNIVLGLLHHDLNSFIVRAISSVFIRPVMLHSNIFNHEKALKMPSSVVFDTVIIRDHSNPLRLSHLGFALNQISINHDIEVTHKQVESDSLITSSLLQSLIIKKRTVIDARNTNWVHQDYFSLDGDSFLEGVIRNKMCTTDDILRVPLYIVSLSTEIPLEETHQVFKGGMVVTHWNRDEDVVVTRSVFETNGNNYRYDGIHELHKNVVQCIYECVYGATAVKFLQFGVGDSAFQQFSSNSGIPEFERKYWHNNHALLYGSTLLDRTIKLHRRFDDLFDEGYMDKVLKKTEGLHLIDFELGFSDLHQVVELPLKHHNLAHVPRSVLHNVTIIGFQLKLQIATLVTQPTLFHVNTLQTYVTRFEEALEELESFIHRSVCKTKKSKTESSLDFGDFLLPFLIIVFELSFAVFLMKKIIKQFRKRVRLPIFARSQRL